MKIVNVTVHSKLSTLLVSCRHLKFLTAGNIESYMHIMATTPNCFSFMCIVNLMQCMCRPQQLALDSHYGVSTCSPICTEGRTGNWKFLAAKGRNIVNQNELFTSTTLYVSPSHMWTLVRNVYFHVLKSWIVYPQIVWCALLVTVF